uniref:G_PROTEIN_RECEP_F1_2 domain-containing protein n=1 Tax=Parastrongyloides trichosuri TaxID=131310 RepID=A0A0N5A629_PARTI
MGLFFFTIIGREFEVATLEQEVNVRCFHDHFEANGTTYIFSFFLFVRIFSWILLLFVRLYACGLMKSIIALNCTTDELAKEMSKTIRILYIAFNIIDSISVIILFLTICDYCYTERTIDWLFVVNFCFYVFTLVILPKVIRSYIKCNAIFAIVVNIFGIVLFTIKIACLFIAAKSKIPTENIDIYAKCNFYDYRYENIVPAFASFMKLIFLIYAIKSTTPKNDDKTTDEIIMT